MSEDQDNSEDTIRSRESNIRAFVRFTNCSERLVQVHWVNFRGINVHYNNLNPTGSCVINTFVTHPWIFLSLSGERLCVRNEEIFYPKPWFKYIVNSSNGQVSVSREEALIHIRLKPLKEICSWQINFLLKDPKTDIQSLQIPQTLKADLLHIYYLSTRYRDEESENSNSSSEGD